VVGAIIPWNFPLLMAAWKLAPALAAGCTVVLKPAEQTPLTALRLGELALEAGLPPGVVNVVPGYGDTGAAIVEHPGVDKIAFTGSVEVGQTIARSAAATLKHVSLELGGKSPNVVFADADLEAATQTAAAAIFANTGQVCSSGSRLYVQSGVFDEVVSGVGVAARALRTGHGLDPATTLGPLISQEQVDRVVGYLDRGLSEGGELVAGGGRPAGRLLRRADRLRRPAADERARARGDLRPRARGAAVRRPGGRRGGGERDRVRPCRRGLDEGRAPCAQTRRAAGGRDGLDQLLGLLRCGGPLRRLQALGLRPRRRARGDGEVPPDEGRLDEPGVGRTESLKR